MTEKARGELENSFGKQLTAAMEKRRIGRLEAAEALQCSTQAISKYMVGSFFPSQKNLRSLEAFLNIKFVMGDPNVFEPIYMELAPTSTLTIAQAKEALSKSLGVSPEKITISIAV